MLELLTTTWLKTCQRRMEKLDQSFRVTNKENTKKENLVEEGKDVTEDNNAKQEYIVKNSKVEESEKRRLMLTTKSLKLFL